MSGGENRRYVHTGSALALGGHLTHPFRGPIRSQGECVVPGCGGYTSTSTGAFNHEGVVSFREARVQCLANEEKKGGFLYQYTQSTVSIDGVNILDVVTAANVTARLLAIARIPIPEEQPEAQPTLSFSTVGSSFTHLKVPGYDARDRACEHTQLAPAASAALPPRQSLVPQAYEDGCEEIPVDDFGTVYLAEFFAGPYSARLTMLRVELGCPIGGVVAFGEVKDGGVDWP